MKLTQIASARTHTLPRLAGVLVEWMDAEIEMEMRGRGDENIRPCTLYVISLASHFSLVKKKM